MEFSLKNFQTGLTNRASSKYNNPLDFSLLLLPSSSISQSTIPINFFAKMSGPSSRNSPVVFDAAYKPYSKPSNARLPANLSAQIPSRVVSAASVESSELSPSFYTKREVAPSPYSVFINSRRQQQQRQHVYLNSKFQASSVSVASSSSAFSMSSFATCYTPTRGSSGSVPKFTLEACRTPSRVSSQATVIYTPMRPRRKASDIPRKISLAPTASWESESATVVEEREDKSWKEGWYDEDTNVGTQAHMSTPVYHTPLQSSEDGPFRLKESVEKMITFNNALQCALKTLKQAQEADDTQAYTIRALKNRNQQLEQDFSLLFSQYSKALMTLSEQDTEQREEIAKQLNEGLDPRCPKSMITTVHARQNIRHQPPPASQKSIKRRLDLIYPLHQRIDARHRPLVSKTRAYIPWGFSEDDFSECSERWQVATGTRVASRDYKYPLQNTSTTEFARRRQSQLRAQQAQQAQQELARLEKRQELARQKMREELLLMRRTVSAFSLLDMPIVPQAGGPVAAAWRRVKRVIFKVWPRRRAASGKRRHSSFYLRP